MLGLGVVVSIRLDAANTIKYLDLCERRGMTKAQFARWLIDQAIENDRLERLVAELEGAENPIREVQQVTLVCPCCKQRLTEVYRTPLMARDAEWHPILGAVDVPTGEWAYSCGTCEGEISVILYNEFMTLREQVMKENDP